MRKELSMMTMHIHQALAQVQELKMRVINAQHFTGYSGRCRVVGGTLALLAPLILGADWYPKTPTAHLMGWGCVLTVSVLANYFAVLHWFLFDPDTRRDVRRLIPTVYVLPSLAVGGILSAALILHGAYDSLFGTWMCLFGLANLSSRQVLPKTLWPLGLLYIVSGTACLFWPSLSFTNPWPMGIVFGIGEWVGGFIFHYHRRPDSSLSGFFSKGCDPYAQDV
jgi:hypothetical protein